MCVSRSFSQYGVLGICTFDTFYHGYFPGAGLPFLFSFGCIPFYITFHSQKSTPHAFARREGFSARFPACLLLPIAAGTDTCRMLCAKPAVELPVMTLPRRAFWPAIGSFLPLQCQGVWLACRLHAGTTGKSVPACVLRTRPSEARRFMFYFFTIAFGAKSQSFSAAKIVCGRERL